MLSLNTHPLYPSRTSSWRQSKCTAHTGTPQPNMSTTFIGKSTPAATTNGTGRDKRTERVWQEGEEGGREGEGGRGMRFCWNKLCGSHIQTRTHEHPPISTQTYTHPPHKLAHMRYIYKRGLAPPRSGRGCHRQTDAVHATSRIAKGCNMVECRERTPNTKKHTLTFFVAVRTAAAALHATRRMVATAEPVAVYITTVAQLVRINTTAVSSSSGSTMTNGKP